MRAGSRKRLPGAATLSGATIAMSGEKGESEELAIHRERKRRRRLQAGNEREQSMG